MKDPDLVDELNDDGTGWARFDWSRKYRYRLARAISEAARAMVATHTSIRGSRDYPGATTATQTTYARWLDAEELKRIVFVLLNPSTADAFKGDRTVDKCTEYARLWGFDVIEVVNIFAWRSPYPEDVKGLAPELRGADSVNDDQICLALTRPNVTRVIAGWGNHGLLDGRGGRVGRIVQGVQATKGFELLALKILSGGIPIHPLARGKNFIPMSIEPVKWP